MSHYSVLVALPPDTEVADLDEVLTEVMAPWEEDLRVAPWKDYEQGNPADFWWVKSVRGNAASHVRLREVGPEAFVTERLADARMSRAGTERYVAGLAETVQEWAEDVRWAERLGPDPLTWERVVALYNEHYGHDTALVRVDDDSDSETMYYDPEEERAYTWTTRNPDAKWDYWRIGGRWGQGYFIAREAVAGQLTAERGWDSPPARTAVVDRLRVDGGPRGSLDFEAMRDEAARERLVEYDRWQEIVAEHGAPPAWADLISLVNLGELHIDDARKRYQTHPAIEAARGAELTDVFGPDPEQEYGTTREEFERQARLAAVPGYALVTVERRWVAPGQMGWFGMSSDEPGEREGYHIAANRYLDDLHKDAFVVVLDCHI